MRLYDPLSVIYAGDCVVHIIAFTDDGNLKKDRKSYNIIALLSILAHAFI
jgi:hypothetical protein